MVAKSPQTICFRASDEERDLVDKVAQVHGLSMSAFLRTAVLEYCDAFVKEMGVDAFVEKVQMIADEREAKQRKAAELKQRQANLAMTIASSSAGRQDS